MYRLLSIAFLMFAPAAQASAAPDAVQCHVGSYRLTDGSNVDIAATDDNGLRWRREDGRTGRLKQSADGDWASTLGWTDHPDGIRVRFSSCANDQITFDRRSGTRIAMDVTETHFAVEGADLAGRLVLPRGSGPVAIVVLVHGSEHDSARQLYALQRQFPAQGIGAFVYDKRGTGGSSGRYTQDYLILATDAVAAAREAKRLAGARAGRIGYQGGSQGGWVAPLAATIEPVDFVIVGFGLAVSPLEEDRSAIALDMTRHGYGADVMAKAMRIADATAAIITSDFQEGYDQLAAIKKQYGQEPWFRYVHGNVTGYLLETPAETIRVQGPKLLAGVPAHYDPMPVLRNLKVPQLWILGADDIDAPSAETARRLNTLADSGRPISLAIFPRAEHGIYEYETSTDGTRISTRQPEGYFAMMRDFILRGGKLDARYGGALLRRAPSPASTPPE